MNELLSTIKENKEKFSSLAGDTISLKVFSNITLNLLEPFIINSYLRQGIRAEVSEFSYDSMIADSRDVDKSSICIVHCDSLNFSGEPTENISNRDDEYINLLFEKLREQIQIVIKNLEQTKEVYITTMSYLTFEFLNGQNSLIKERIEQFNYSLNELEERHLNLKVINFDNILFNSEGSACINTRELYNSVAPYKFSLLKNFGDEVAKFSSLKNGKVKKVLALDCDNTLWHGTIAEDGQEGIKQDIDSKEGKIFKRIQEDADFLANNGAIVCLASKNFEEDVLNFFKTGKTHLNIDNVSAYKVNWKDKAGNLKQIATELNLGIDSFIFVDDTDHEVNLVRQEAPEVLTIQVPSDINNYPKEFSKIRNQFVAQKTKTNKAKQYKQIFERNRAMSDSSNVDDFLEKLGIKLVIYKNNQKTSKRVSDLSQKTNQFNMTTKRFTEKEILDLMNDHKVYCFETNDRFGESGITGVAIVKIKNELAEIDTFLLSCRILGRNIENEFLNQILIDLRKEGTKKVLAPYFETLKNKKFGNFYQNFGFTMVEQDKFQLDLEKFKIKNLNYIEVDYE